MRGARSRLLRRAGIGRRERIVELGAGWGIVASELCVRAGRRVIAVDRRPRPQGVDLNEHVDWLVSHAETLPLATDSVDLVFAQFALLWMDAPRVVAEVARVLRPGGAVAVIEPDFGGLMEYPEAIATQTIWVAALQRAGADPVIGRKVPGLFAEASLKVETRFLDRYEHARTERLGLLRELPLSDDERERVSQVREQLQTHRAHDVSHLPLWMVLGTKPST